MRDLVVRRRRSVKLDGVLYGPGESLPSGAKASPNHVQERSEFEREGDKFAGRFERPDPVPHMRWDSSLEELAPLDLPVLLGVVLRKDPNRDVSEMTREQAIELLTSEYVPPQTSRRPGRDPAEPPPPPPSGK